MTGILGGALGSYLGQKISVAERAKTISTTAGTGNLNSGAITTTAGRIYIVMLAFDPSGNALPTVTLSDTANTYTGLAAAFTAPATTSAGTGVLLRSFITTAAATATRTITATFSASISSKAMTVIELIGATTTQRNVATSSRGTTAAPNYASPSGNQFDMILTTLAQETNVANDPNVGSTSTTGGVWSAISNNYTSSGGAASNVGISYQYKLLTATGAQTNTWTMGSTANWGSQSFAIQAA
jgi:hypothetical protein